METSVFRALSAIYSIHAHPILPRDFLLSGPGPSHILSADPPVPTKPHLSTPANSVGPAEWSIERVHQLQGLGHSADPALVSFLLGHKRRKL